MAGNTVTLSNVTPLLLDVFTWVTDPVTGERNRPTAETVSILNIDAAAIVYLGDATVNAANAGVKVLPGQSTVFDQLGPNQQIYAISDTNASKIDLEIVVE